MNETTKNGAAPTAPTQEKKEIINNDLENLPMNHTQDKNQAQVQNSEEIQNRQNTQELSESNSNTSNLTQEPESIVEMLQKVLVRSYHDLIQELADRDSAAFYVHLANMVSDSLVSELDIDENDESIPSIYRLIKRTFVLARQQQKQVEDMYPLPEKPPADSSPTKIKQYEEKVFEIQGYRQSVEVIQCAFERACYENIRFDLSTSTYTYNDRSDVVWSVLDATMKRVLNARQKNFYDGTPGQKLRNLNTNHIEDNIGVNHIYRPVKEWAKNLPAWDGVDRYQLMAQTLHMDAKSQEFEIVKTWFKGTMNRWLVPGTKHDNALIIHGKQGRFKSTFFKNLAPKCIYDDERGELVNAHSNGQEIKDKDELLRYHKHALVEFDEIETMSGKQEAGAIKKFLSQTEDDLRPAYARKSILLKRGYSCCGTVNVEEFLKDLTGNRRFIIISVGAKYIDSAWLEDENEQQQFWAQVKEDAELLGYVPRELSDVQEQMSRRYQYMDTDTEMILEYMRELSEDQLKRGILPGPIGSGRETHAEVPMNLSNLGFAIFGAEYFTNANYDLSQFPSSKTIHGRADRLISGKLKSVLTNRLGMSVKQKRFEGKRQDVYCLSE
ncbi:VapE domain-containing protein [Myxosarcina sp. GI1(2024)]